MAQLTRPEETLDDKIDFIIEAINDEDENDEGELVSYFQEDRARILIKLLVENPNISIEELYKHRYA